jgi:hypothetical protein
MCEDDESKMMGCMLHATDVSSRGQQYDPLESGAFSLHNNGFYISRDASIKGHLKPLLRTQKCIPAYIFLG